MRTVLSLSFVSLMYSPSFAAEPPALVKKTYTFKKVGDVRIEADADRPDTADVRPVAACVHGGKVITGSEDGVDFKPRTRFYLYCRQNGVWTKEVTGLEPTDTKKLDPYCPVRNVTADYPPTMLVHGTTDTDVPYELSANMAKEF